MQLSNLHLQFSNFFLLKKRRNEPKKKQGKKKDKSVSKLEETSVVWKDNLFHCKVKNIKTQRQTYCAEEKELTKSEYLRLLEAAKDRPQLHLILETISRFLYCHFYLRFYHLFTYFSCAP